MLKIREVRLEKGLSVPKLSELSGVSRRTIQDLEKRGDCMISTAAKLSSAMNVSLNDIWEFQVCQEK
ncbi:helix-turn-helix domain-containing protein [bacterium 210820-DFI.6.37]|nr:helix-turn-helix domain-containing protein [bacterium 210820-DFI.6.37]